MKYVLLKKLLVDYMKASTFALVLAALVATCAPDVKGQVKQRAKRPSPAERERDKRLKDGIKLGARLPFISDVRVTPSASNAVISFRSSQRTPPLVEVGRVAPQADRFGVMAFPLGASAFTRFVQPQDGRYTLNFNASNEQLDAGTTYYYIINVFNDNQNDPARKREQEVGEVSTFSQSVKVVWEKILITADSDDGGAGEISLWFWINYGQPGALWLAINDLGNNSATTGQTFGIGREYVVENAPNDLSLSVSGVESDTPFLNGVFGKGGARGSGQAPPLDGPSSTKHFDYNVAKETIDLTSYPSELGATRSQTFQLVSNPNGRLKFEVYGHFEITRRAQ